MTEQEKNKEIQRLIQEWKDEADKIIPNEQPKKGARLDNGKSGPYYELAKKYQAKINEIRKS